MVIEQQPEICDHSGEIIVDEYLDIIEGEELIYVIAYCDDCGESVS